MENKTNKPTSTINMDERRERLRVQLDELARRADNLSNRLKMGGHQTLTAEENELIRLVQVSMIKSAFRESVFEFVSGTEAQPILDRLNDFFLYQIL